MTNKNWLWAVKIVAAIFNFPATAYVFYDILSSTNRPEWLTLFNTFCAVLLIDVLFIWVLGVLEASETDPVKRIPAAFLSLFLVVAVIWIGFKDEGSLSFAPRIGLVGLVFNDWMLWGTDIWQRFYSREQQEKRIRDKEVIYTKKQKSKAAQEALKNLYKELVISQEQRLIEQLNLFADESPIEATPKHEIVLFDKQDLEKFIRKNGNGYVWEHPYTGEIFKETATGKPYTLRGAKLALTRKLKEDGYL